MAKRQQTTGMPSRRREEARQTAQQAPEEKSRLETTFDNLLGNPQTREEREEAISRLLTRSVFGFLGALVVIVVAFILYDQFIVPNQTVVSVRDEGTTVNVSVAEFEERVRIERVLVNQQLQSVINLAQQFGIDANQLLQQPQYADLLNELNFPDQLGRRVIDDLVDDAIIRIEAEQRGISVDDDVVQSTVNDYFGYDPTQAALIGADPTETPTPTMTPEPLVSPTPTTTPTVTPTPTPLPAEVTPEPEPTLTPTFPASPTPDATDVFEDFEDNREAFYRNVRAQALVGNTAIDRFFERQALREAVREVVVDPVETQTVVEARHILVETEEQAQEVLDALASGESFADLARAVSTDNGGGGGGSAANGGYLGEAPSSNYVPEFREAVETAPLGEIVGPVESQFGYHIIQVRSRSEEPIEENAAEQEQAAQFEEWLTERRDALEAAEGVSINDNWPDFVPQT